MKMCNLVTKAVEQIYKMDNDQLNEVIDAIKLKRQYLAREATRSILKGDNVSFQGRRGQRVSGKVEKVNPKTIIVLDSKTNVRWKVSATMVTKLGIGEEH